MSQGRQGLEQSGDDARAAQVKTAVVELHQNNALVCVAKRQCFENLKRGLHERPYLGVQVRSSIDDITGSLLLLLCIAWCEEAVSPADDRREHFMHVMRHEVTEEGLCTKKRKHGTTKILIRGAKLHVSEDIHHGAKYSKRPSPGRGLSLESTGGP